MIIFDQDATMLEWASQRLKVKFEAGNSAWLTNLSKDGEIQAVVVYTRFSPFNCEMSVASNGNRKWFSRECARAWFGYPFNQMKVRRVSAVTETSNLSSIRMLEKLGFVKEATLSNWFGDTDGVLYRMLEKDCKWIR